MRWKDMGPEERYQVVEMALTGKTTMKELCETFRVSRQTLHRAMDEVRQAALQALAPKPRGRKPKPPDVAALDALEQEKTQVSKEMEHWKTKYEVAKAVLDLERKYYRGELEQE